MYIIIAFVQMNQDTELITYWLCVWQHSSSGAVSAVKMPNTVNDVLTHRN